MSGLDTSELLLRSARTILEASSHAALKSVDCQCYAGTVTLSGRLPSYYHKQLAQELIARIEGVHAIVNSTEVGSRFV